MSIDPSVSTASFESRPSYWFAWHRELIVPGARVLDVACGAGRHAIAAASLGARVVAADRDRARLVEARREAERLGLSVEWLETDLERDWPTGTFDVVLAFNYLDRPRMHRIVEAVAPGGLLIMETFLEIQRQLGWGPTKDAHLLKHGEISSLVTPLEVVHGREAYEPTDEAQWAALASVVAQRRK